MTTNVSLRPILDRKQWEMCSALPVASAAGFTIASSLLHDQYQFVLTSATTAYLYDPAEDAWALLPTTTAITGTYGAGTCTTFVANGPTGTALAGSTPVTLNTGLTLPSRLAGYTVRLTGGTGAGQERVIARNTLGANSTLTVTAPWDVTPDATTTYLLLTGRFYAFVGGTSGPGMRYFDMATQTWSAALSMSGLATLATDAKLRSTPGFAANFATGTATGGTSTTLTNSAKTWAANQWKVAQVRLTGGTGAGQVRTITGNTGTQLTVSPAWETTPDATTTYVIEGNDDYLYLIGGNAAPIYRYSISGNAWTTLSPTVARGGNAGAGCSLNWVRASSDPEWSDESNIINGRRLYSFRGGASAVVDYYDIPSNAWVNNVGPARLADTFTTGSAFENAGNGVLYAEKEITGRFFRYDVAKNEWSPWHVLMYPQGTAGVGDRMFTVDFIDGGTKLTWVYFIISTGNAMFRSLII